MSSKLDLFREDVKVGDEVVLDLTTKRTVRGRVVEITQAYLKLVTSQGTSRFFEEMLGSWEVVDRDAGVNTHGPNGQGSITDTTQAQPIAPVHSRPASELREHEALFSPSHDEMPSQPTGQPNEKEPLPEPKPTTPAQSTSDSTPAIDVELLSSLFKIDAQHEARVNNARIEPELPSFELPDKALSAKGAEAPRQLWDRIRNRYSNAQKINELDPKFGRIQPIVSDLRLIANQFPRSIVFKRQLAACLSLANNGSESLAIAKEAAQLPNADGTDWLNLAAIALRQNAEEISCLALEQLFRQRSATQHDAAWFVFLRLVHKFRNFVPLGSLYDATHKPPDSQGDDCLTQAAVYLLKATRGDTVAASALQFCRQNSGGRDAICEVLGRLPTDVSPHYRKVLDDWVWETQAAMHTPEESAQAPTPSNKPGEALDTPSAPLEMHGHIVKYNRDKNYGFIDDGTSHSDRWGSHFFHGSSVVDDKLLDLLHDEAFADLQVVFQSAEGPRGKVALQISLRRTPQETLALAKEYAALGEYAQALFQIRPLLNRSDCPEATRLYDRWREFSRVPAIPKGANSYARARRLQLVEKDYEQAVALFRKAIQLGDNTESAIKDLATLFTQMDRATDAIELLETYQFQVSDRKSLQNHLLHISQKAGQWTKAEELLKGKLRLPRLSDRERIMYLRQIARAAIEQEKYADAERYLSEAKTLRPDNASVGRDLALCLSRQRRYDDAVRVLNELDSSDPRILELLDAIAQARRSGELLPMDDSGLMIEAQLSDFSSELSRFTLFFLDRCAFDGVRPDRLSENRYCGTIEDVDTDTRRLEAIAKEVGATRPRDRSNYYLSAARIRFDLGEGDHSIIYRYLCRSFASCGDAAVGENRHLDTAREWYVEALRAHDGDREGPRRGEEQDAINALVRCLYSTLGQGAIPLNKAPTVDATIDEVINHHPQRAQVFELIRYISTYSKYAGERILQRLFNTRSLQVMACEYLRSKGILIAAPTRPTMEQFVKWWNELRQHANSERNRLCAELRSLRSCQLTVAWLGNGIDLLSRVVARLMFDLDRQRVLELKDVLEQTIELCKQNRFEEIERLCTQTDLRCNDLLRQIEQQPTKISVEELYSIVNVVREKVSEKLRDLYDTSRPSPELRLAVESYCPDESRRIEVQVVIENKVGRGPAESVEIILDEIPEGDDISEPLFTAEKTELPIDGSLRGGEQRIVYMPLRLGDRALQQQDFSIPLHARFRTRTGEIQSTPMTIFPIRLNPDGEFKEIENPFAEYCEGSIVDKVTMFKGRDDLIETIARVIKAPRKGVVVFGQKRAGKSSILYHLKKRLQERQDIIVLDVRNIGSLFKEDSELSLFDSLLWTILRGLGNEIANVTGRPQLNGLQVPNYQEYISHQNRLMLFCETFRDFASARDRTPEWANVRCVVLIDEFSYIYQWILQKKLPDTFMKNWKALLQEDFFNAVVVGQDNMPKFKERFANEFGVFQDERVSYLKRQDAVQLIDEPIRIVGEDGQSKSRFRERAIDRLLELTAGSPFYIQMICNRLVEYMNRKRARLVTEADVEQVKDEMIRGVNALSKDKFENLYNSGDTSDQAISDDDSLRVCSAVAVNSRTGPCNRQNISGQTTRPIDEILADLVRRDVLECERGQYYQMRVGLFKEWLLAHQ